LGLLGVLCLAIGGSQSKAVVDQQPAASQVDSKSVAQQRIDLGLGLGDDLIHDHHHEHIIEHHEHHHEHHDPGYWKKKVTWKEGWKKIWNPAKKQIWNPSWKKVNSLVYNKINNHYVRGLSTILTMPITDLEATLGESARLEGNTGSSLETNLGMF